jgi:two-component system NtrC family sensor kinase
MTPVPSLPRVDVGLRHRLALRIGVGLCLGAAAILAVAGVYNLRLQRTHLTRLVGASANGIAETIRGSTRDGMLRNDAEGVHRIIMNIGTQQGISKIRIFNKEGRIRTSTEAEEVGSLVDIRAEECYACHQKGQPLERLERADRVRLFRNARGERILGVVAPIHNEAQCVSSCHAHSDSQRVLGVLDVQLSMGSVEEALAASERQMAGALAATVGAVVALAGLLLWRMVLRPVEGMTAAIVRVAGGDLTTRVTVRSPGEMGVMAASWNAMTEELARARTALEEWNEALERRVEEKTAELQRSYERMSAVERMASLGKLAAVVAHEINNPLAGIRTYARLLRRRFGESADPETDRILQMVDSESGRCGDIVKNLLTFSRSGPARLTDEDLKPVSDRCALLLRHQAEILGVSLTFEVPQDLPRLRCDAAQIEQMILALAMNALDATPVGGRVTVAVRRDPESNAVLLVVSDNGCGIAEEDRSRIFEPFFTTKTGGKGVGLGLAVVYGIVTRHGGRIDVLSAVGSGTTFTVRLPLEPPPEVP